MRISGSQHIEWESNKITGRLEIKRKTKAEKKKIKSNKRIIRLTEIKLRFIMRWNSYLYSWNVADFHQFFVVIILLLTYLTFFWQSYSSARERKREKNTRKRLSYGGGTFCVGKNQLWIITHYKTFSLVLEMNLQLHTLLTQTIRAIQLNNLQWTSSS